MGELMLIGSGCGIPYKNYGPPCFAIKERDNAFIVDIGYDSLQKILEYVDVRTMENIFITHTHPDHFWGLVPLCFYLKCLNRVDEKHLINIYGHGKIGIFLSFIKEYYNWFDKEPDVNFVDINKSGCQGEINDISYYAIKAKHSEDSLAYKFIIQNKKIVFTGDTEYSEELVNFSKDAYILVCECSYIKNGEGHMDVESFKRLSVESKAEKAVLVHNYREIGYELELLKLKEELGDSLVVGKDGLVLNF